MSKRNSDGDVLTNKLNLGLAKQKSLLASWMGTDPASDATNETEAQFNDEDLKQDYAHDRLGVGSILPKDIADGSFTRRIPTSNDKLLVQLLGAKKAKAHIASQREAARPNASAKAQQYGKPMPVKKVESDEEEEGRAATFKSKRSKRTVERRVAKDINSDDEDEEMRAKRLGSSTQMEDEVPKSGDADATPIESEPPRQDKLASRKNEVSDNAEDIKTALRKSKTKPKSFLDEILAERSKKKKKSAA
ncbi:hypothetical protein T440DRAFT_497730 [Plenodomus tracheiphilus IPT5]|uniref:Uncharacterized protein n=1 Tax=Plenodomus tracheiphilus IPT5 TaxID=1408161 RepID=A0A6A7B9W1_9PLEO|nr:hypothetical protein T440DRAFT_497730 [Plenodomus tracheiphilus IPT5]